VAARIIAAKTRAIFSMTLLYYDPRFLEHDTGRGHPERSLRLTRIVERLETSGFVDTCKRHEWAPVSRSRLELIHDAAYVEQVTAMGARGGGYWDADTVVSPKSVDVALLAAGAAADAVDRVLNHEADTALCLLRPPGHHALNRDAMGFCLFNNAAIAAQVAIEEHGLDRVLIVDWDVHHGNGTQDLFYADGRVGFFSSHRFPFWPGTGDANETGTGRGLGATRNLPIGGGVTREQFLEQFRHELEDFAVRIRPQLVLVSAGFDSHRLDPLGRFLLETEDYTTLTRLVRDIATHYAEGRVVSVLEGGYNPDVLAECVEAHLRALA
jgi:acetoin utilization deacetylase AcuC-like enzyme